jgi:hypothetical protein
VFFDIPSFSDSSSSVQPFASIVNFRKIFEKSNKKRHLPVDITVVAYDT